MDLGLGNLDEIKKAVLPDANRVDKQFDFIIAALASGVAAQFNSITGRKLGRQVNVLEDFTADRTYYVVQSYPLESVTVLEQRDTMLGGWYPLNITNILNQGNSVGLVEFGYVLGQYYSRIRLTYSGGFFYETLEPFQSDGVTPTAGYPTALPTGAATVPANLKAAWYEQVRFEFTRSDRMGKGVFNDLGTPANSIFLQPFVAEVLSQFRRYVS